MRLPKKDRGKNMLFGDIESEKKYIRTNAHTHYW